MFTSGNTSQGYNANFATTFLLNAIVTTVIHLTKAKTCCSSRPHVLSWVMFLDTHCEQQAPYFDFEYEPSFLVINSSANHLKNPDVAGGNMKRQKPKSRTDLRVYKPARRK
jgi:hypothetical protein